MGNTHTPTRVVVAGDWHGNLSWARTVLRQTADLAITTVVHVGDLGIGPWGDDDEFTTLLDGHLTRLGLNMVVCPGNHENWDRLERSPVDAAGAWVVGRQIRVLPRGARATLGNRTFGFLGGAVSVDQRRRVRGRSWWPQEEPGVPDLGVLGCEPLDVLVTHDVPTGVPVREGGWFPQDLITRSNAVRLLLADAVHATGPRLVFSGHWHQRVTYDLRTHNGQPSRVHVLDREHTRGNAVVLDLQTLSVTPLPDAWNERSAR